MKQWKKLTAFAPALCGVILVVCMGISLTGYTRPVFQAETGTSFEPEELTETESEKEETTELTEEETETIREVTGAFELEDGIYEGRGTGFAGQIRVAVEVKNKTIQSIEILEVEADDAAFFNRAKGVIDKIIASQSLEVDVISGATYSSNGIIGAVRNALTGETGTAETTAPSGAGQGQGAAVIAPIQEAAAYLDGVYYGSGTGFGGTLQVKVTVSGGQIAAIEITQYSDGSSYIQSASQVISAILSTQSTNVDTVSGATYSSVGIIEAVRNALSQAAANSSQETTPETTPEAGSEENTEEDIQGKIPYPDGIYYGTGEGYEGDITCAVVIQDQIIKVILITESEEDEPFFSRAKILTGMIIKKQSTEVDTVSGATYSSLGIIEAVENALKAAEEAANGDTKEEDNKPGNTEKEDEKPGTNEGDNLPDGSEEETPEETKPEESDGSSETETEESWQGIYQDGTYTGRALCVPDEDEEFDAYELSLKLTVFHDRIVEITEVAGNGDSSNDTYIRRAANGTSKAVGVVEQITEKGTLEDIDAVSRATCSSNAIVQACQAALTQAEK